MVSSNQDLITLFQKRQVDYLVRFCNADLLAAVDAVVEEMEDFYTSGEMVEYDYALSREEFYAKMPVHRRVDGKLLIKKLKENNELVEQAISAVVIDHFINLETQCSHGVTEESKEVKVLIRNQPELHAVFSSDGITFEGEGNVQRRWGSSDSLEFLRQLSVWFASTIGRERTRANAK